MNESAEDFTDASKPAMESSSFLLFPSCCKTEISSSPKAWLVVASSKFNVDDGSKPFKNAKDWWTLLQKHFSCTVCALLIAS